MTRDQRFVNQGGNIDVHIDRQESWNIGANRNSQTGSVHLRMDPLRLVWLGTTHSSYALLVPIEVDFLVHCACLALFVLYRRITLSMGLAKRSRGKLSFPLSHG